MKLKIKNKDAPIIQVGNVENETAGDLILIEAGEARDSVDAKTGCLKYTFETGLIVTEIMFHAPTLYMYVHELLVAKSEYPFPHQVIQGLYECNNSSLLGRIKENWQSGDYFCNNRHFVYWDHQYLSHIVAPQFEKITLENK